MVFGRNIMNPWFVIWLVIGAFIWLTVDLGVIESKDGSFCLHYGKFVERAQEIKDSAPEA